MKELRGQETQTTVMRDLRRRSGESGKGVKLKRKVLEDRSSAERDS